jgi:hypothetical protein
MVRICSTFLVNLLATGLGCLAQPSDDAQIRGILTHFPGYHLLTLHERESDTRAFLLKHFPGSDSSLVHADFDGDGTLDYALLLRGEKPGSTELVILLCAENRECKSVHESQVGTESVYLKPVPAGSKVSETDAPDGEQATAKLNSPGIRLAYFEKAEVVFYWDRKSKKIVEVETGD